MSRSFFSTSSRSAAIIIIAAWIVLSLLASFWWIPAFLGSTQPIPPSKGVGLLILFWVLMLNDWSRLGTKVFFRQLPKYKVVLLAIVSVLSAIGFFA